MNNEIVGIVKNIRRDTYQKQLIVNKEGNSRLVPLVYGIIKNINLEEKIIELDNIKGLID